MKRGSLHLQRSNSTSENALSTVHLTNSGCTVDSGNENCISEAPEISNVKTGRTEFLSG